MEGQKEDRRVVNMKVVKFKYSEVVVGSYIRREGVGNHNELSHDDVNKSQIGL